MGDRSTSNHRPQTTDRMHRHKHRHEPTNKTQGPSAISHRPSDESHHTCISSCSPAKDPARIRIRETTIRSLHCTVNVQYLLKHLDALHSRLERALQSTAVPFLPASCNVAATQRKKIEKRTHLQFRSHADGLACLEHPSIFVATSGPAQSILTLLNRRQYHSKDPFRPWPGREFTVAPPPGRLAAQMHEPRHFGNISWCAHRCDIRIDTSSTANGLALQAAHSPLLRLPHAQHMQEQAQRLNAPLVIHLNLQPGRSHRHSDYHN